MFRARKEKLDARRVPMRSEVQREKSVPDFVLFGKAGIGKA